ncbi:glutaminase A [soil metagenome]
MDEQVSNDRIGSGYISSGHLPPADQVKRVVNEAFEHFRTNDEGSTSQVYPALTEVDRNLFGVCVVGVNGETHAAGDVECEFTIMSVSKPFVFALVCQEIGPAKARALIGANSTGMPFNSLAAIEHSVDGLTNPMVNSGAIATTSLAPGTTAAEKWAFIRSGLSKFAGRTLSLNEEIYRSASETNLRNRGMSYMLQGIGRIYSDPMEATDIYTLQCSLNVTAKDLAVMGATLADGGVNPITKENVVDASTCHYTLAAMTTAGLYETSDDWLYEIGLPGKSGIGGGIVTVSPGKGALGTFAPPLDQIGNSVKGQLVAKHLSQELGMNLFASKPHESAS